MQAAVDSPAIKNVENAAYKLNENPAFFCSERTLTPVGTDMTVLPGHWPIPQTYLSPIPASSGQSPLRIDRKLGDLPQWESVLGRKRGTAR